MQGGIFVELVEHFLGLGAALELDDDAHAALVALVAHIRDLVDFVFSHQFCNPFDQGSFVNLVRNLGDHNLVSPGLQVVVREEAEWLRLGEEVQRLETRLADATRVLDEARAGQASERADIAERRNAAVAQRNAALEVREASAAQVERALRARYDRLRSKKSAPPVVPLVGFACSACYSAIPVSRRGEIRAGLLVDGCEACGVILYAPEAAG